MMERQDKTLRTTTNISNPILYVPKIMFLTKGKGLHKTTSQIQKEAERKSSNSLLTQNSFYIG